MSLPNESEKSGLAKPGALTSTEIRRLMTYDPETGVCRWLVNRGTRSLAGNVAGSPHCEGYLHCRIYRKQYMLHRLIWLWMTGEWPRNQIDHVNGNRIDNRWANLRDVLPHENNQNRALISKNNNTSGLIGIYWSTRDKNWRAQLRHKGKLYNIGRYATVEDALRARNAFKFKMHTYAPVLR